MAVPNTIAVNISYGMVAAKKHGKHFLRHGSRKKCCVAEDVEHVLAGGNQDGLALADIDAIDVGLTPQTHHDDEGVAVEVNLLGYLDDDTMDNEIGTVDEL